VAAVGKGAQDEVLGRIDAMGTNLGVVSAGQMRATVGRQPSRGSVTTLTAGDAAAVVDECPSVVAAVSLFVGGFGILAIMLMAVRERTRGIGLRMTEPTQPLRVRGQSAITRSAGRVHLGGSLNQRPSPVAVVEPAVGLVSRGAAEVHW
jgi:hypothetical protein